MKTATQIADEIAFVRAEQAKLRAEQTARRNAFEDALRAEFLDRENAMSGEMMRLRREQEALIIASLQHPLEGRRVTRSVRQDPYGLGRTITEHGVIVCVRNYGDLPTLVSAGRVRQRLPNIGDTIVQRLNAKGEKLTKWTHVRFTDGGLPWGWALV